VLVTAENRYQAFRLALAKMGECAWSNPDYNGGEQLTIQRVGRNEGIKVTREQFEKWVKRSEQMP
jgi:hypothetical protein